MSAVLTAERHEQRMVNLVRANVIRIDRADLKRRIAAGKVSVSDVLARRPPEAASWLVGRLLRAQDGWGVVRVRKFLEPLMIGERRAVGALTERQCRLVIDALAPQPALTPGDREIMLLLGRGDWVRVSELVRESGVESPEIVGRVRALRSRGLVSRSPVELRRHAFGWRLTELGSVELAAVMGAGG